MTVEQSFQLNKLFLMRKYYLERQEYIEKNSKLIKNLSKKLDIYFFSYKKNPQQI